LAADLRIEMCAASGIALDVNAPLDIVVGVVCDVALRCVDEK
jgi:hypothetical protein